MRIAAAYEPESGTIFQHFGRTEFFKLYEVEDNQIVSSQVISSNGTGHGALAGLLAGQQVDVLICGGIGGGAQSALEEAGISLCSGAQGDADQAAAAYLNGELVSTGVNCNHHHGEGRTAAAPTMPLPDAMSEKPAAPITEAPSTTGRSLILPTTAGSPWNLSAERA